MSFEKFRAEYNTFSGDLDDAVKTVFEGINNGFKSALDSVQKQYNDMIVDPDSTYQKALTEVLNQKQRVLAQKKAVNELPEGKDKEAAQKILEEKDGIYTISAEVFGKGIDMWLRSQGDMVEVI